MCNLKQYLSCQPTSVLLSACPQTQEHIDMINEILQFRTYLTKKYSYEHLLCMDADALINLLNHSELRSDDRFICRSIMSDILDVLELKYPDANIRFGPELIAYLSC